MATPGQGNPGSGFSLLELLVVMTVIGILAGIGIGFLGQGSENMDLAWSVLRDKLRLACETARSKGRRCEVVLLRRQDAPMIVQARILSTVGQWHLEPDERYFAGLVPNLSGFYEEGGRYGQAMRPDLEKRTGLFVVGTEGRSRFGLRDGFAFKIELKLEARKRAVVARLGRAFRLELDMDLSPRAQITLADPGPKPGLTLDVEAREGALRLDHWVTLELVHDGSELRLLVDGILVGRKAASGEVYQQAGDMLEVSPGDTPVHGLVDEIQLLAYERGAGQELPAEIQLEGFRSPIAFDRRGRLVRPLDKTPIQIQLTLGEQKERRTVAPGGVLK